MNGLISVHFSHRQHKTTESDILRNLSTHRKWQCEVPWWLRTQRFGPTIPTQVRTETAENKLSELSVWSDHHDLHPLIHCPTMCSWMFPQSCLYFRSTQKNIYRWERCRGVDECSSWNLTWGKTTRTALLENKYLCQQHQPQRQMRHWHRIC